MGLSSGFWLKKHFLTAASQDAGGEPDALWEKITHYGSPR